MKKVLILVRHAHRDTSQGREKDNGLSYKGKMQSERLKKYIYPLCKNSTVQLFSSPKKRCVETLNPLTKQLHKKIYLTPLLLEKNESETLKYFFGRIQKFFQIFRKNKAEITIACTHVD